MNLVIVANNINNLIYNLNWETQTWTISPLDPFAPKPLRDTKTNFALGKGPDGWFVTSGDVLTIINSELIGETIPIPDPFKMVWPHHLVCNKNILYITDTGHDRVVTYDLNCKTWDQIIVAEGMKDTRHVNSLLIEDENIFVMCHNRTNPPSDILIYNNKTLVTTLQTAGAKSHHMWRQGDDLWFCDSEAGKLRSLSGGVVDLGTQFSDITGFLRGTCVTSDSVYIGNSYRPEKQCGVVGVFRVPFDGSAITFVPHSFPNSNKKVRSGIFSIEVA